jgi:O-antigen ligase
MTLRVAPSPASLDPIPSTQPNGDVPASVPPPSTAASAPSFAPASWPRRGTDAFRLARGLIFILAATALDVTNYLDKGSEIRYVILLVPIGAMFLARRRGQGFRRLSTPDKFLLVLFAIGFTGTMVGTFALGTKSGARPIFLPMLLAFLYLGTVEDPTRLEVRSILRALAWVGLIYASLSALTHLSTYVPWGPLVKLAAYRQYKNATLLYLMMGIAATLVLRWRLRAALTILLGLFIFRAYPSGTAVIVVLATLATVFLTRRGRRPMRRWVAGVLVVAAAGLVVLNFGGGLHLTDTYFAAVGKRDNNGTRLALWQAGIDEFQRSPVYGSWFSGPTVIVTTRAGQHKQFQLPFHNDYILFLVEGGVIGLGLLLGWAISTELLMLRRYRAYVALGEHSRAAVLRTLLIGFNAFFVAAAFNPLFTGMSSSATIFSIYGLMILLGSPASLAASGVQAPGRPRRGYRPFRQPLAIGAE